MSLKIVSLLNLLPLYIRSRLSANYAERKDIIGYVFNRFGHRAGWRLLYKAPTYGIRLLLNPVSITRYFEFEFVNSCLSGKPGLCLDVSSPRLLSLYFADMKGFPEIEMINPDIDDIRVTKSILQGLNIKTILPECQPVDYLSSHEKKYDYIWSISVIEHIKGNMGDKKAVELMYNSLKIGGSLLLTVPVDRNYWKEYREVDYYGTQGKPSEEGEFFFQRFYDRDAIENRLILPLGITPQKVSWFGERTPGIFHDYIRKWRRNGIRFTVDDPKFIVDHYKVFNSWDEMPGVGVCGIEIKKE